MWLEIRMVLRADSEEDAAFRAAQERWRELAPGGLISRRGLSRKMFEGALLELADAQTRTADGDEAADFLDALFDAVGGARPLAAIPLPAPAVRRPLRIKETRFMPGELGPVPGEVGRIPRGWGIRHVVHDVKSFVGGTPADNERRSRLVTSTDKTARLLYDMDQLYLNSPPGHPLCKIPFDETPRTASSASFYAGRASGLPSFDASYVESGVSRRQTMDNYDETAALTREGGRVSPLALAGLAGNAQEPEQPPTPVCRLPTPKLSTRTQVGLPRSAKSRLSSSMLFSTLRGPPPCALSWAPHLSLGAGVTEKKAAKTATDRFDPTSTRDNTPALDLPEEKPARAAPRAARHRATPSGMRHDPVTHALLRRPRARKPPVRSPTRISKVRAATSHGERGLVSLPHSNDLPPRPSTDYPGLRLRDRVQEQQEMSMRAAGRQWMRAADDVEFVIPKPATVNLSFNPPPSPAAMAQAAIAARLREPPRYRRRRKKREPPRPPRLSIATVKHSSRTSTPVSAARVRLPSAESPAWNSAEKDQVFAAALRRAAADSSGEEMAARAARAARAALPRKEVMPGYTVLQSNDQAIERPPESQGARRMRSPASKGLTKWLRRTYSAASSRSSPLKPPTKESPEAKDANAGRWRSVRSPPLPKDSDDGLDAGEIEFHSPGRATLGLETPAGLMAAEIARRRGAAKYRNGRQLSYQPDQSAQTLVSTSDNNGSPLDTRKSSSASLQSALSALRGTMSQSISERTEPRYRVGVSSVPRLGSKLGLRDSAQVGKVVRVPVPALSR